MCARYFVYVCTYVCMRKCLYMCICSFVSVRESPSVYVRVIRRILFYKLKTSKTYFLFVNKKRAMLDQKLTFR